MVMLVRTVTRLGGWILVMAILALSFVPANLRPETGLPHNLEHFAIFCATGVCFGVGYDRRRVLTSIALVVFAAAVELGQNFVPDRHARLTDFIVDAAAASIGVLLAALVTRVTQTKF
jgi:VanZ family protein